MVTAEPPWMTRFLQSVDILRFPELCRVSRDEESLAREVGFNWSQEVVPQHGLSDGQCMVPLAVACVDFAGRFTARRPTRQILS